MDGSGNGMRQRDDPAKYPVPLPFGVLPTLLFSGTLLGSETHQPCQWGLKWLRASICKGVDPYMQSADQYDQ